MSIASLQVLENELKSEKKKNSLHSKNNKKLLNENIELCRVVKKQKENIQDQSKENTKLKKQLASLFHNIIELEKTSKLQIVQDKFFNKSLTKEYDMMKEWSKNNEERINKLTNELDKKENQIKRNNKVIKKLSSKILKLNKQLKKKVENINELKTKINEFNSIEHKNSKELNEKINELTKKNNESDAIINDLNQKIYKLENKLSTVTNKAIEERKEWNEMKNSLQKDVKWWKNECDSLEKEFIGDIDKLATQNKYFEIQIHKQQTLEKKYKDLKSNYIQKCWDKMIMYLIYENKIECKDICLDYMKLKQNKTKKQIENDATNLTITKYNPNNNNTKLIYLKENMKLLIKNVCNHDINIDEILLKGNISELTNFVVNTIPKDNQKDIVSKLLPLIQEYRTCLMQIINSRIQILISNKL